MNIKFSIIVTTHRRAAMLNRALKSIREMRYKYVELIVVSDYEDVETFVVSQEFLTEDDVFIKRNGKGGPAQSRNAGVNMSSGDYIIFLDDDDTLSPDLLKNITSFIKYNNIIYWNYNNIKFDRNNEDNFYESVKCCDIGKFEIYTLLVKNFIPINCVAVPRALAQRFAFDINLRSHEDWDFLLAIFSTGSQFTHCPIVGSNVYQHCSAEQRNTMTLKSGEWGPSFLYIYHKWPAPEHIKKLRKDRLSGMGISVPQQWL